MCAMDFSPLSPSLGKDFKSVPGLSVYLRAKTQKAARKLPFSYLAIHHSESVLNLRTHTAHFSHLKTGNLCDHLVIHLCPSGSNGA